MAVGDFCAVAVGTFTTVFALVVESAVGDKDGGGLFGDTIARSPVASSKTSRTARLGNSQRLEAAGELEIARICLFVVLMGGGTKTWVSSSTTPTDVASSA